MGHTCTNASLLGAGITTSLIALIANAGQTDQAIATAGSFLLFVSSILSDHMSAG